MLDSIVAACYNIISFISILCKESFLYEKDARNPFFSDDLLADSDELRHG